MIAGMQKPVGGELREWPQKAETARYEVPAAASIDFAVLSRLCPHSQEQAFRREAREVTQVRDV